MSRFKSIESTKIIVLTAILLACPNIFAATLSLQRTDGSSMRVYLATPQKSNFPVAVLLQGSVCVSSKPMFQAMQGPLVGAGIAVIAVEKYGLDENTTDCPQSYLENNTIQQRILDHLQLASYLRQNLSGWNGHVGWAGGSEGGQVASLVAPLVPETSALLMLASGGGMTMAEELPLDFEKSMARSGSSSEEIRKKIDEIQDHYNQIKSNPTWKLEWLSDGKTARNTYKWWDSILWIKALPILETLKAPIYIAHGTEDSSCAYESSKLIADRFAALGKSNLTFKTYPGLEHNFSDLKGVSHQQEVMGDALQWLVATLIAGSNDK
jgi:dienelactone hydrolase